MNFNEEFYNRLHAYCLAYLPQNTWLKPEHVAGLVFVENGRLDPKASRFEASVMQSVSVVKEGIKSSAYPGFNSGPIKKEIMSAVRGSAALQAIATSWGFGQLMGYHYIEKFEMSPQQFMNMDDGTSITTTIDFMLLGTKYAGTYEGLLRWHNTGSITGKTYDPNYVAKATKAKDDYANYVKATILSVLPSVSPSFDFPAKNFSSLSREIYADNKAKGFWEKPRGTAECIALMHSELSEALEADRKPGADSKLPQFDGLTVELADCVIRIMDFAGYLGLSLGEAIKAKVEYNRTRPFKHGKEY